MVCFYGVCVCVRVCMSVCVSHETMMVQMNRFYVRQIIESLLHKNRRGLLEVRTENNKRGTRDEKGRTWGARSIGTK